MNFPKPTDRVLVYRRKGDTEPMVAIVVGGPVKPSFNNAINLVYWDHLRRDQWRQAQDVPYGENEDPNCLHGLFWKEAT